MWGREWRAGRRRPGVGTTRYQGPSSTSQSGSVRVRLKWRVKEVGGTQSRVGHQDPQGSSTETPPSPDEERSDRLRGGGPRDPDRTPGVKENGVEGRRVFNSFTWEPTVQTSLGEGTTVRNRGSESTHSLRNEVVSTPGSVVPQNTGTPQ